MFTWFIYAFIQQITTQSHYKDVGLPVYDVLWQPYLYNGDPRLVKMVSILKQCPATLLASSHPLYPWSPCYPVALQWYPASSHIIPKFPTIAWHVAPGCQLPNTPLPLVYYCVRNDMTPNCFQHKLLHISHTIKKAWLASTWYIVSQNIYKWYIELLTNC